MPGTWLSNVDFNNGTTMEYDLYAGVKPTLGPVALDLGVIYYGYAGKPSGPDEAYWEAKVAGSVPVGKATIGAAVYLLAGIPVQDRRSHLLRTERLRAARRQVVVLRRGGPPVRGRTGRLHHLEPRRRLRRHPQDRPVDLRYWDTDEHSFGKIYDSRVALAVKATF